MVGGLFYVHIHTKEEQIASEVVNFEQAREIQRKMLKMSPIPNDKNNRSLKTDSGSDFDVVGCLGPGIDLNVMEDFVIRPLGSAGRLVAAFNIFKPTFKEVLQRAEEVRTKLIKNQEALPYDREDEYYQQALEVY